MVFRGFACQGHDWIVRPDGLILFALKPDMALSVEGSVHNGSLVVLRPHNGKPEPSMQSELVQTWMNVDDTNRHSLVS